MKRAPFASKRTGWLSGALLVAAFLGLGSLVSSNTPPALDAWFCASPAIPGSGGVASALWVGLTSLGGSICLLVVTAAGAVFVATRHAQQLRVALAFVVLVGTAYMLRAATKEFYGRARPQFIEALEATSPSFPSGHACMSLVIYGGLLALAWRGVPRLRLRLLACAAVASLVMLIGASRVILGVHYPTDILGGYLLGLTLLLGFILLLPRLRPTPGEPSPQLAPLPAEEPSPAVSPRAAEALMG